MVEIRRLTLDGVLEIRPPKFGDARGFFSETYNRQRWAAGGVDLDFVQDNHSFSAAQGTLRGLHYQLPPRAQDKRLCRKPVVNLGCGMRALHFGELADVQWPSLRPISNPAVRTLVSGL